MRAFSYIGDHDSTTLWGITFPRGVAVSVSDAHALRKLSGNNHFAEVFDGVEVVGAASGLAVAVDVVEQMSPAGIAADAPLEPAEQRVSIAEVAPQPKRRGRPPKAK